jgi:hypothetical protein
MRKKKSGPVRVHRARDSSRAFNNASDLPQETDLAKSIRALHWRKVGRGWLLYGLNRRCFGEVVPDSSIPGMWRTPLWDGRLSDYANLSWARAAVFDAAMRELEWEEARQSAAATPLIPEEIGPVFGDGSPPSAFDSPAYGEAAP